MKTATVRDLRNHYTSLLGWISAGEEIVITQRGKPIARLIPENPDTSNETDWANSPAVVRNRKKSRKLTSEESAEVIRDASGKW